MNLKNKKELAARTLKVGKERIIFVESRKDEIKEAITKNDIRDLIAEGAILIKNIKGRKKIEKRGRRSTGNIRKMTKKRKKDYIIITRKLRKYAKEVKAQKKITKEILKEIGKKIKNRGFKNKIDLQKYVESLNKK